MCESDRKALMDPVPFLETMTGLVYRGVILCLRDRDGEREKE